MFSSTILDAGQALTVAGYKSRQLRTQSLVSLNSPNQNVKTAAINPSLQSGGTTMAVLEKLHTQKRTANSGIAAIEQIKTTLKKTQSELVNHQTSTTALSDLQSVQTQKQTMLDIQTELDALRSQVESDSNEKAIFQAVEKVVKESVSFYSGLEAGVSFSKAMDDIKKLNLSALASQAQIEKVQSQLAASTFHVVQLASSYEAGLFTAPSDPFKVAEDLYGFSFQLNSSNQSGSVGSVLDLVS